MVMNNNCPTLPDCRMLGERCLTHQWYSNTRLSNVAQELLLELDFHSVSSEDVDMFIESKCGFLLNQQAIIR